VTLKGEGNGRRTVKISIKFSLTIPLREIDVSSTKMLLIQIP